MVQSSCSLTGQWSGEYAYPFHSGPTTPFLAVIQEDGGRITGTIIEPDVVSGNPILEARIVGLRTSTSVDFTKIYPSAPCGYENPVDYVGSISESGNTITGVWSLLELDGTFEMRREISRENLHEDQVSDSMSVDNG